MIIVDYYYLLLVFPRFMRALSFFINHVHADEAIVRPRQLSMDDRIQAHYYLW